MIVYQQGTDGIQGEALAGFFESWPSPPSAESLLRVLSNSTLAMLAKDHSQVVGFANALSDGEMAVYIPLLEVHASYRGKGIGTELVRRVFDHFNRAYMIDVVCDPDVAPFYERFGMTSLVGMALRNRQSPILTSTDAAPDSS